MITTHYPLSTIHYPLSTIHYPLPTTHYPLSTIHYFLTATLGLALLAGCGSGDPFKYVQVSGKVTYEDGSLIPIDGMALTFYPQGGALDAKTHPRPGMTAVDRATGEFHSVTSHKPGDGLVPGKYKVTLLEGNRMPLPADIVPLEYGDPFKTPLEVDTANQPFVLKVRKPQ